MRYQALLIPLLYLILFDLAIADDRRIRLSPEMLPSTKSIGAASSNSDLRIRHVTPRQPMETARQLPDGTWITPWPGQIEIRARRRTDGHIEFEEVRQ